MFPKKRRLALFLVTTLIATASLAAFAQVLLHKYSLPGSAQLRDVETRLLPILRQELSKKDLLLGSPVHIRIYKESSELELWIQGKDGSYDLFKTYPICRYSGTLGPKLKEGDRQSPEGFYEVSRTQMNPRSTYHLAFNLGFPNAFDRAHNRTGSFLMVHGNCLSIGCYAMTDKGIEEIYLVANESLINGNKDFKVHIFPFRMTTENMSRHAESEWLEFWQDLKLGYDAFEKTHLLPEVSVKSGRYRITTAREKDA